MYMQREIQLMSLTVVASVRWISAGSIANRDEHRSDLGDSGTSSVQHSILLSTTVGVALLVAMVFVLINCIRRHSALEPTQSRLTRRTTNAYEDVVTWTPEQRERIKSASSASKEDEDDDAIYSQPYRQPANKEEDIYAQLSGAAYRHLKRADITIQETIGAGEFGEVCKGTLLQENGNILETAIKSLRDKTDPESRLKFLKEAAIMGQFKHPNVVQTLGVVTEGSPFFLVLELMSTDLRKYLISIIDPPSNIMDMLFRMSCDISLGMTYLSSRGFIHRDLAARNIMINKRGVCKIGDFGMARDISDDTYYFSKGGVIPVKWSAPEAVCFRKFSTASDVWSFGIVLWEIFEFGRKPYAFWSNEKVLDEVQDGYRLAQPKSCPAALYDLMIECWTYQTEGRPSFARCSSTLKKLRRSH